MSEENDKIELTPNIEDASHVKKVYYDIKLRRDSEKDAFEDFLKMSLFGLIVPVIITFTLNFIVFPKLSADLIFILFMPMLIIALVCLAWYVAFMFIGGKFAKLSWMMFLNKQKGLVLRIFKTRQLEISVDKISERIEFVPGDKITEQTVLEEKLLGSANFVGRPVAILVQDRLFNIDPLVENPPDPSSNDYTAGAMHAFNAGVFFNELFQGRYTKYLLAICIVILIVASLNIMFSWTTTNQAAATVAQLHDINTQFSNIIQSQNQLRQYIMQGQGTGQVFVG